MKTEQTKHILINSYYSELDYSGIGSVSDDMHKAVKIEFLED